MDGDFGKQKGSAANNHGTFHHTQVAALAATCRTALALRTVAVARTGLIIPQIAAAWGRSQELARTRGRHYSTFDRLAFTRLAAVGDRVGVDLRHRTGPEGSALRQAVGFLLLYRHRRRTLAPPRAGLPRLRRLRRRPRRRRPR